MFKTVLTVFFCATVFFLNGAQVWPEDMEDHFIDPNFDSSKNIFIDVKAVSLVNVLKIISQQSGLSFIADQDVADKKITLYLNKIPLNQALHMVLDAYGLTYELQNDSNVFVVKAKPMAANNLITRVYQLKYATVFSSKMNSTITIGGASTAGASSGSSGGSTMGGLEQVLKDSLSPDGKVVEDTRTNSLIITDKPDQFGIIESTITKLDVPVPQILIEVEMIDVSKSVADQLGITYGATPMTFQGGIKAVNYPFSDSPASSSSGGSSGGSSGASNAYSPGSFNANGLQAALNLLTTNTDARTLARPRILTLNNETAEIQISTNQAIDVVPSSSSSGTAGSTQTFTVDRATTGVILKVTPQANLITREITMAVSPRDIDIILSQVQPPAGVGGTIYDPETRGSDSILKLRDGQSMVIGGLVTNQSSKTITKIPFLGDLPMFGALFRSTVKSKRERELIIFLTPHIIDDGNFSALKGGSSSMSVGTALDIQDASDRAQNITNSLNTYEMKKY